MRAAVTSKPSNPFEHSADIKSIQTPKPGPREVTVNISTTACCHTDIHAISGDWTEKANFPFTPGHEAVGRVSKIGERVIERKVGERVGLGWLKAACGKCEFCTMGWETLCPDSQTSGFSAPGYLSEYGKCAANCAIPIPDTLDDDQAACMICSGATALKALKESELRAGQFVVIIGAAGGVGHLACQLGAAMGLHVLAVEVNGYKKRFCESLGAELAIDLTDLRCDSKSPAEQIREHTEGLGAHAVLCCASDAKAVSSAVDMCRRTGVVVVVATPPGDMRLPIADMVLRRITVRGCAPPTKQDILEALDFAARGVVRAQVTHAQLSDVNRVYDRLKQKAYEGKVVIRM